MGKIVDPLENAWVVTQPSTTVPDPYCYIVKTNTTNDVSQIKERVVKVERDPCCQVKIYDWDGTCECGQSVDAAWEYCPCCGGKLKWK